MCHFIKFKFIWYTPKESNFVYTLIRRTLKTVENEVYSGASGW